MKRFMGILPLRVGLCTLSATFAMLAISMISVNMWSLGSANLKSCFIFLCLIVLMISTWVITYIGSYIEPFENSLFMMTIALKLWKVFMMLWIALTVWSLFFTNVYKMNEGFTCIKSRCVPSCFLVTYGDEWTNKSNETVTTSTADTEETVEPTTLSSNESTVEQTPQSEGPAVSEASMLKVVHKYNDADANFTFGLLRDKNVLINKTRFKRKRPNSRRPVNKKMLTKLSSKSMVFITLAVSGYSWEIVVVPLIFYLLFACAKSTLYAYIFDLKFNMQLLTERC